MIGQLVLAFGVGFLLDWAWARYTLAMQAHKAIEAATLSVVCWLASTFGVVTLMLNGPLACGAFAAGLFLGTALAVKGNVSK